MRIFKILIIFYSVNVPFPVFPIFNNVEIIYSAIQFTNFKMLCLVCWLLMVLVNFWSLTMLLPKASHPRRSLWILLLKYLSNLLIATVPAQTAHISHTWRRQELYNWFSWLQLPHPVHPAAQDFQSFLCLFCWCFTCLLVFKHKSVVL